MLLSFALTADGNHMYLHNTCAQLTNRPRALLRRLYMVMDYFQDDTLMDYYNAVDHMPEPLAYGWFAQLYSALEFVHSKGSTHRDVKLDNEPLDRQRCIRLADVCVATERPSCAPAGATPAIKTNRCRAAARCTRRRNYWTRT
uniref:Serine/threonine-protein kinase greatwall n=1 Tax=Sipha flava TaxID=143950 RepID=A0A2S2Q827_9HEMI